MKFTKSVSIFNAVFEFSNRGSEWKQKSEATFVDRCKAEKVNIFLKPKNLCNKHFRNEYSNAIARTSIYRTFRASGTFQNNKEHPQKHSMLRSGK